LVDDSYGGRLAKKKDESIFGIPWNQGSFLRDSTWGFEHSTWGFEHSIG
jgi:hypothetical protein